VVTLALLLQRHHERTNPIAAGYESPSGDNAAGFSVLKGPNIQ
jgi:hypothetical protein